MSLPAVSQPDAPLSRLIPEFSQVLEHMGARDKLAVEKHVAACEAEGDPEHARLWKRLVCVLAALAWRRGKVGTQTQRQFGIETRGQRAIQFFIPDGKYRRQLFALEDLRDGKLSVYLLDVMDAALESEVIQSLKRPQIPVIDAMTHHFLADHLGATVRIELLSAQNSASAPDYYRHMVGWNRKAIKATIQVAGGEARLDGLTALCSIAARQVSAPE